MFYLLAKENEWFVNSEQVVHKQGKRFMYNVLQLLKWEAQFGEPEVPVSEVKEKTAETHGVSRSTVQRVAKEGDRKTPMEMQLFDPLIKH